MSTPSPVAELPSRARSTQFDELDLEAVAECLKVVAHPARLRLIDLLLAEDLTVNELAARVQLPQPVVSGHLRRLQAHRLLAPIRRGKNVYYHVTADVLVDLCGCIHGHFSACAVPRPRGGSRAAPSALRPVDE
ncbi:metalloregulator ArsR/SmtB family transcription factor [Myxococcota bacterium]|nr:metalloregulator ArsR/SmtB family transcription factor [Myxococcota bacterium]